MNEKGQLFIIAIIALAVVTVSTIALMSGSSTFNLSSKYSLDSTQALNLAEAGMDKAVASLNKTAGSYAGETETTLNSGSFRGSYSVEVIPKDITTKIVKSTGYVPNKDNAKAKKTIIMEVSKGTGVSFTYGAQIGEGGLYMKQTSRITGSVYSNKDIRMENNATISGDAWAAGGISGTPNQSNECIPPNCGDYFFSTSVVPGGEDVAFSFKLSQTSIVSKISVKVKEIGSSKIDPGVDLATDQAGKPYNTLASSQLLRSAVGTNYSWVDIIFSNPPTLQANTQYWIVFNGGTYPSDYFSMERDTLSQYSNGSAITGGPWRDDTENPGWSPITTGDFSFKIYTGATGGIIGVTGNTIGGNAHANTLKYLTVTGGAYYKVIQNVTAGSYFPNSNDPAPIAFPISQTPTIDSWETQALNNGGSQTGDVNIPLSNCSTTLASKKYIGNVTVVGGPQQCIITVGSPIHITGNLTVGNNVKFQLNTSYGYSSGTIIVDNFVNLSQNDKFEGTGQPGSYMVLISKFNTRDDTLSRNAITLANNGNTGIMYSNLGGIFVTNGNTLKEVTGWKLTLENGAAVTYEQGLASAFFSAAPTGSYSAIKGSYQVK